MAAVRSRTAAFFGALLVASFRLASTSANPGCPVTPGYSVVPNLLVDGGDLGSPVPDLSSAIASCNGNVDCVGFTKDNTGNFQAKNVPMIPSSSQSGACMYTKLRTSCPSQVGYTVASDVDSAGAPLTQAGSLAAARAACEPMESCQSFSSDSKLYTAAVPMKYAQGKCFYIKLPSNCPAVAGYSSTPDYAVQDTILTSTNKPLASCNSNQGCIGYNRVGNAIYGSETNKVYTRGNCFYKKTNATNCPNVTGYNATPDQDLVAPAIAKYLAANSAATACTADNTCAGFSTSDSASWTTRQKSTRTTYVYGSCLYLKKPKEPTVCQAVTNYTAVPDKKADPSATPLDTYGQPSCDINPDCKGYEAGSNKTFPASVTLVSSDGSCYYTQNTGAGATDKCGNFFSSQRFEVIPGASLRNVVYGNQYNTVYEAFVNCAGLAPVSCTGFDVTGRIIKSFAGGQAVPGTDYCAWLYA